MRLTWETSERVDVTFSRAAVDDALRAVEAVSDALTARGYGYTVTTGTGAWEGQAEHSTTFGLVGANGAWRHAVRAAHAAGCTAVQVERYGSHAGASGYACEEWRPDV